MSKETEHLHSRTKEQFEQLEHSKELAEQLKQAESRCDSLEEELSKQKEQAEAALAALKEEGKRQEALSAERELAAIQLKEKDDQLLAARAELGRLMTDRSELELKVTELVQSVEDTQKRLKDTEAQIPEITKRLNDALSAANKESEYLADKLKQTEEEMKKQLEDLRKQNETTIDELKKKHKTEEALDDLQKQSSAEVQDIIARTRDETQQSWIDKVREQTLKIQNLEGTLKRTSVSFSLADLEVLFKKRPSRTEDLERISQLEKKVNDNQALLQKLTASEDNKFLRLELLNREDMYNKVFTGGKAAGVQPMGMMGISGMSNALNALSAAPAPAAPKAHTQKRQPASPGRLSPLEKRPSPSSSPRQQGLAPATTGAMDVLLGMGFAPGPCEAALASANGDVSAAAEILLSSAAAQESAPQFDAETEWVCPACTLVNSLSLSHCSMCSTPNPARPAGAGYSDEGEETDEDEEDEEEEDEEPQAEEEEDDDDDDEPPRPAKRMRLTPRTPPRVDAAALARAEAAVPVLGDAEVLRLLRESVPGVDAMLDRLQQNPVPALVLSTYHAGLPMYQRTPAIREHTVRAMRYIFHAAGALEAAVRRRHLQRVADCFTACQAEQARVIDAVYGALSGRDRGLREQVLALVDEQKQRVFDQVANLLNPAAWRQGDGVPQMQLPHIQTSYKIAVGAELGLRGVEGAAADHCAFAVGGEERRRIVELFTKLFSVAELVQTLVDDVNQQSPTADRLVDRDALCKWASSEAVVAAGFVPHSLYYDEERKDEFGDAKPEEANQYQPFLSKAVALRILCLLFDC
eukprot:m51a1_g3067 hypothetical protein (810) ;mRNA; f:3985-7594